MNTQNTNIVKINADDFFSSLFSAFFEAKFDLDPTRAGAVNR